MPLEPSKPPPIPRSSWSVLQGVLGLISFLPLWLAAPYRPGVTTFLLACIPAFGFWGAAWVWARRGRLTLPALLVLGLLLRLGFAVQPPSLSEDAWRYLWDGHAAARGISPYAFAPEQLDRLQAEHPRIYSAMAHRERTSIYPPLAQLFFFGAAAAGSLTAWKLLLLAAEVLLVVLLVAGLRVATPNLALWLLHPLVVLEFYSSGHLDLLALVFLAAALVAVRRGRGLGAGLLLAGGILVKLFPLFVAPLVVAGLPAGRKRRAGAAACGAALALGFGGGFLLLGGAGEYLQIVATYHDSWLFNSLLFHLLPNRELGGRLLTAGFLLFAAAVALGHRAGEHDDLWLRCYFVLMAWCLLTPTLHPWYLSWPLLAAPVLGTRCRSVLYLSAAAPLSYLSYALEQPGARPWLLWAQFGPALWLFYRDLRAYYDGRDESPPPLPENHPRR